MDWSSSLTPWNIGSGLFGLAMSIAMLVSLVRNRQRIGMALTKASARLFSPVGFFSLVIVVFMLISVLESGEFFNVNITHRAMWGLLGYALALGFDLVSVVCMQARLNATRMRDDRGSRLNLIGVSICAAVSAFANAAGSLQGYNPVDLNHTPGWMQISAPWLGMVFPALIVVLSMTMDHILDHAPSRGIDVETFRERERKRVGMLQVRLETERELLTLETQLSTLRQQREVASGHVRREWFFWHWLRPVVPEPETSRVGTPHASVEDAQPTQADRSASKAEPEPGSKEETGGLPETIERDTTLQTQDAQEQEQVRMGPLSEGTVAQTAVRKEQGVSHAQGASSAQGASQEQQAPGAPSVQGTPHMQAGQGAGKEHMRTSQDHGPKRGTPLGGGKDAQREQGSTAEVLLAAFHRFGVATSDNSIARATGYSRKTVARWRKRFQQQGRLPVSTNGEELPIHFPETHV